MSVRIVGNNQPIQTPCGQLCPENDAKLTTTTGKIPKAVGTKVTYAERITKSHISEFSDAHRPRYMQYAMTLFVKYTDVL